jgi:PTS system mannose-specific IIA component
MLGLLVVTHGRLADELVASTQTIVGDIDGMEAVSFGWDDDVESARDRIEAARKRVDSGDGVLILTDMFGGTPTNIALSMLEPGKVEIVTGVNLPMLIKFSNVREAWSLEETADAITREARQAIQIASRLLQASPREAPLSEEEA